MTARKTALARKNGYRLIGNPSISRRIHLPTAIVLAALSLLLAILALAALLVGSQSAGVRDLADLVLTPENLSPQATQILWDLRLPRVLLALLSGAMLGLAGSAMQTLTRNGLADPGLLGVKEGASVAAILFALHVPVHHSFGRIAAGMAGGLIVALLVAAIARDLTRMRFVMIGIGISWAIAAILSIILTTADIRDVQSAMVWMAGSLNAASWRTVPIALGATLAGSTLLFLTAAAADGAIFGRAVATGLGINLRRLTIIRFAAPVLLTAACVSIVGSLGFVGLIAPHLARLSVRANQFSLLCGSALFGAGLVLAADTIGRAALAPLQLPAGIVMSIVGVPVLLALLWIRRDQL